MKESENSEQKTWKINDNNDNNYIWEHRAQKSRIIKWIITQTGWKKAKNEWIITRDTVIMIIITLITSKTRVLTGVMQVLRNVKGRWIKI